MKKINLTTQEEKALLRILKSTSDTSKEVETLKKKLAAPSTRIKPSSAKAKGRSFQQHICRSISTAIGVPYLQGSDDSLIESRGMGQNGVDVILRGEAKAKFPFAVECKNCESWSLTEVIQQAKTNEGDGQGWWLVCLKRQALPENIVIMSEGAFFLMWSLICKDRTFNEG